MLASSRCSGFAASLAAALLLASSAHPAAAAPGEAASEGLQARIAGREIAIAHPPLEDPEVRSVADADHMRRDDVIVGLVVDGKARAYPWWVLKNYHVVNDVFQETEVLIAFCEQCSAGTAFRRRLGERLLSFETEGVCGGTIILRDRETDTLWAPFDGKGLEGPLESEQLARLPVFLTTWQDWSTRHPTTDVVYESESQRMGHGAREHPGKWGIVGEMGDTMLNWDTRLAENDFIFGIRQQDAPRAYPLETVQAAGGLVEDTVGDAAERPVVVFARGAFEMAGYDRRVKDRVLSFEAAGEGPGHARDRETGSLWTVEGLAVDGPLRGERLEPVDGYLVEWHVWAENYPFTEIFGETAYTAPTGFTLPMRELPRLIGERVRDDRLAFDTDTNLIMVWARWCPPCLDKVPLMKRLAAGQEAGGYRFASVVVQLPDQIELGELKAFLYEHDIDWPIYLFDDERYTELDALYRKRGGRGLVIPTVFVVDRTGTVTHVFEGEVTGVEKLLASRAATDG
ncbi:MAG: DUF3179 domain-containing (seleno)protein [Acidobacteriota bacterium]